jgi:hypothetical protein
MLMQSCLVYYEMHDGQVVSGLESCESPVDFVCSKEGGTYLMESSAVEFSQVGHESAAHSPGHPRIIIASSLPESTSSLFQ